MVFRSNLPAADCSYIVSDHEQREWHVSAYLLPPYEFIYGYSMEFDEDDPDFGIDQDHLNDYRTGDAEVIDGTIKILQNGQYYFCDRYGTLITGDGYEYAGQFDGGLCIVGNSGKYGIIDTGGNIVVPLRHKSIYWNYVTPNRTFQLPHSCLLDMPKLEIDLPHYTYGQPRRYLLEVENWNLYMPWRTSGKLLIFHDGFEGVMDLEGNVRAPLCYDTIQSSGIAKRGEKWALLNEGKRPLKRYMAET